MKSTETSNSELEKNTTPFTENPFKWYIGKLKTKNWLIIALSVFLGIMALGIVLPHSEPTKKTVDTNTQEQAEETISPQLVEYELLDEEDLSYAGCNRVGVKLLVDDNIDKGNLAYTLDKIVEDKKSDWQDITVWAYKESLKDSPAMYNGILDQRQYSECN